MGEKKYSINEIMDMLKKMQQAYSEAQDDISSIKEAESFEELHASILRVIKDRVDPKLLNISSYRWMVTIVPLDQRAIAILPKESNLNPLRSLNTSNKQFDETLSCIIDTTPIVVIKDNIIYHIIDQGEYVNSNPSWAHMDAYNIHICLIPRG